MARYHPGDIVTVRPDIKVGEKYYMDNGEEVNIVVGEMAKLAGCEVTIEDCGRQYSILECGYSWTDDMFIAPCPDFEESDMPIMALLGFVQ